MQWINFLPFLQYYEQQYGAYEYPLEANQQQQQTDAGAAASDHAQKDENMPDICDPHGATSTAYEQTYGTAYEPASSLPTDPGIQEEKNSHQSLGYGPVTDQSSGPSMTMFNPSMYSAGGLGDANFSQPTSSGGRSRQGSLSEAAPPSGGLMFSQPAVPTLPPVPTQNGGSKSSGSSQNISAKETKKETANKNKSSGGGANTKKSSWLGGIFGKFVGSTNQVHLPDDSDKKIVYDEKLGRWVNLDGDEDDLAPAAPPPMDPSFAMGAVAPAPGGAAAPSSGLLSSPTTGFRAQPGKRRGRGYVDVFGQAGATKPVPVSPMMLGDPMAPPGGTAGGGGGGLPPTPAAFPTIFNPTLTAHSSDDIPTGFAATTTSASSDETTANEGGGGPASMPMMFNPSYMTTVTAPPAF